MVVEGVKHKECPRMTLCMPLYGVKEKLRSFGLSQGCTGLENVEEKIERGTG